MMLAQAIPSSWLQFGLGGLALFVLFMLMRPIINAFVARKQAQDDANTCKLPNGCPMAEGGCAWRTETVEDQIQTVREMRDGINKLVWYEEQRAVAKFQAAAGK
jgi:flagellar biosynthesis/type III secretory pathway M-ring protein FliF/YscJ